MNPFFNTGIQGILHALDQGTSSSRSIVFDERGAGNSLLLPAGPLREALPGRTPPNTLVLYNARRVTTHLQPKSTQQQQQGRDTTEPSNSSMLHLMCDLP